MSTRLAEPVLSTFFEKSLPGTILPYGVLPLNNNPGLVECPNFRTSILLDKEGDSPIGFGVMNRLSAKQAYCMVGQVSDKYKRKFVSIEKEEGDDVNSVYRVKTVEDQGADKNLMRTFHAVFGEDQTKYVQMALADSLFEQSIGTFNMDMEKNITVDVLGNDVANLDIWRDHAGFVIADACRFAEITCKRKAVIDALASSAEECTDSIVSIGKENTGDVLDFDEAVTLYQRAPYVNYLLNHQAISGFIATSGPGSASGYGLVCGNRVLQCYAENSAAACKLLTTMASQGAPNEEISFFARLGANPAIDQLAYRADRVQIVNRLHTRTKSMQVKWEKVHVVNIGFSII